MGLVRFDCPAVLACRSRDTPRAATSNRRLITFDEPGVVLRYKVDRRAEADRQRMTTLSADELGLG